MEAATAGSGHRTVPRSMTAPCVRGSLAGRSAAPIPMAMRRRERRRGRHECPRYVSGWTRRLLPIPTPLAGLPPGWCRRSAASPPGVAAPHQAVSEEARNSGSCQVPGLTLPR